MKKFIFLAILATLAPLARSQGVRFDSQVQQEATVAGVTNVVTVPPNAVVSFCNFPANAAPCTNKATTYTSIALSQTCPTSTQLVLSGTSTCVANADTQGNWGVWVAPGIYAYTYTLAGANFGPFTLTLTMSGAAVNITNTFTAQQNFDANVANKGPNPWADVTRFGGYFGTQTPPSTTGAITTGTPALVLANAQDFANGQGVLVLGAGPATSLSTPTGVQAAPWGVTGSTTYKYCVVAEDYLFGRTACSAAGTSTTSVATLGVQTATLSSCNRVAGIVTCATTAPHNFTAGAQVNIVKNSTGDTRFEGAFSIFATPTGSTFTFTQYGAPDVSGTVTSGSAQVNATNIVKWNSDVAGTVLKWHVYRCSATCTLPANAANYALVGTVVGVDGYFQDYNLALAVANNGNGDVPATAPITATNTALSTTILSGGGTTSPTLANNASATVAGAKVLHDNTPNLVAACTSFTRGGTVYIPTSNVAANYFPINSPFKFSSCAAGGIQLQINNKVFANAPIIMSAYDNIQGLPGGRDSSVASPSFYDLRPHALITGFAYPFIYIPATVVNSSIDDIDFVCNQTYMPCIYHDQLTTGGSATSLRFRHVHANSGSGSNTPWVVKGGFGIFWEYGGWANAASSFAAPPGILFSPNCGLGNTNQQQAYLVTTQYTYGFNGTVFDSCSQSSLQGLNNFSFRDMLGESGLVPMFRFANTGGVGTFNGNPSWWELVRTNYADSLGGIATPVIDATMVNQITGLHVVSPGAPQGPLIETNSGGVTGLDVSADFAGIVGAQFYGIPGSGIFANIPAKASGTNGHFAYAMALPSPVQSAVVSAGGAVPVGAHTYTVAAVDFSGNETTLSTGIVATTTGGNQTVTLTHPAAFPAGAKGINEYRDGFRINNGSCGTNPQFTTPGGTFADTSAVTCGNSPASANNAGATLVDANGLTTSQLRLSGPNNIVGHPDFGGVIGGFFQINGTALAAQDIFNLQPDASTPGITFDPSGGGGNVRAHLTATAGGGTSIIACTLTSPAQKQILAFDGSSICKNANPAVLTTDKATVNTTSYPLVALDLGNDILRKAAGAMTDTWPQGGSAGFPIGWYGLLCNTDTVNSDTATPTTSTVNGQSSVVITPNTCGHMIVDPANNWRFHAFNWVKPGTGLSPTYNVDGSTTIGLLGGGSLTTGFIPKWNGTQFVNSLCDESITVANRFTCTHTAGIAATVFTATGTTAGFTAYTQNPTSAAVAPCNNANTKCIQAGTALTSNLETLAPATAQGIFAVTGSAAITTEMYSGDSGHSATVTTGSGTSITSTSLCSTANCPVGTYVVNAYLDITTACTTTGTYSVSLVYTDDQGSKTIVIPMQGPGETAGVLNLATVTNFGQAAQVLRSTGAASINYLTTAAACGSGGPMVGKLYLSAVPVQ